jgi:hypothetical protein
MIMKRNNIFIFQWAAWLCAIFAACSGLEEELPVAGKVNVSGSDTRAELIEYTIDVETAGTLDSLVENGEYADAQKLVVTGNIGYEDVHYVDVNMPAVEVLDLSGAAYDSELIEGAFLSDSTQIKEIALPGNITYISYKSSYNSDTQSWEYFYPFNCSSVTNIILPESLSKIGSAAFYNCSSLTSIKIPESVTSIGYWAFGYCSFLTSINIPESVTSIGYSAFYGCSSLASINIPEGVTSIGDCAFYDCSSLISINIPESVTSIGNYAFHGCSSLTSIDIPEGVTSIGDYAFYGCSSLTSINIPEGVTSIGNYAFNGCTSLRIIRWNTSCSLPDGFSSSDNLILYNTEDIPSSDGSDNYTTTAEKAVYTKNFGSRYNNNWYTIALPFKPTEISHEEKGVIAPFRSGVEGVKNFWLRELTPDGYQNVTEMEPNHAYIIAMPTSTDYSDEYRLNGNVTFSAENVTITWETIPSEGATYTLYPTFETVKKAKDVYALNSEYWMDGYGYGRVFVRSAMDVEPLQAYVKWNDGATTMRSVLPVADGKRTAVRGASSTDEAGSRGAYGQRKPQIDDM